MSTWLIRMCRRLMWWENLIKIKLFLSVVADNLRPRCFSEKIITHTNTHRNFAARLDLISAWIIKGCDRNPLACLLSTDQLSAVIGPYMFTFTLLRWHSRWSHVLCICWLDVKVSGVTVIVPTGSEAWFWTLGSWSGAPPWASWIGQSKDYN